MDGEGYQRGPVTYALSREPPEQGDEEFINEWLVDSEIRQFAIFTDVPGEYSAFSILYVDSDDVGTEMAHRILGTSVAHERKFGPLWLRHN